ncbi:DUF302 domain-containing protein [Pseudorhodobacter sp. E13]|uniref:DUF302 domain-containing protein n=1 Tax=Pseudorhodobacter sp. E13 TaxID=2487931 RepID=UPI000F8C36A8|nr:DUF302 domain-containing protein [Pseudorhodobacter sp. E13]RUS65261.1 DUF302 domain-containing protein [Pseudorhodobacter sp. E13]
MFKSLLLVASLGLGSAASAQEFKTYTTDEPFDDVAFAVESAILSAGLVIDHVSHTGEMLERTRADMGSDKVLFLAADVYEFCSASVSRQVMEADPLNFHFCPYAIRVYEQPESAGTVTVSHQVYDGSMAPVQALLESIVNDALGLD